MQKHALATMLAVLLISANAALAIERTYRDDQGRTRVRPAPTDARMNNPWPASWEDDLAVRVDRALQYWSTQSLSFNSWGENEKRGYPQMMWAFLLGDKDRAVKAFEEDDYQRDDHRHTLGVDFYWCFTLKGQMRKFFYFGEALSDDYRAKFRRAAAIWTEKDPYRRPHPVYGTGGKGSGWGPDAKGSWVDVRRTDNLRAMTDTSVYLMAELAGNEATRRLYRERILAYVRMLYNAGMMEWDSENYHGHTLAPYHNLYDFAEDPEVKKLAKAALDWLYAAGAVKYWRGGFGGPNNRDYGGGNVVFGGGTVQPLWLYFGDAVIDNPAGHCDDVHHVTSGYRPPPAVVELARKNFSRPAELHATKPDYSLWDPSQEVQPRYWETTFFGKTYQLGSARSRAPMQPWTPSMLKMTVYNSQRGLDYFVVNTSELGEHSVKNAGDQIAQYRNLLIWLRPADRGERTFYFQLPRSAQREIAAGVWLARMEKTYLAIHPIQLPAYSDYTIPLVTEELDKKSHKPKPNPRGVLYRDEQFFQTTADGKGYAGFAMEVGEEGVYAGYEAFKQAVVAKSHLDTTRLAQGIATLVGIDGRKLTVRHNPQNDLPEIQRDGAPWDYAQHLDVYGPEDGTGPIAQRWRSGTLTVEAGGKRFTCTVAEDGKVSWENGQAR
ncbi:MAG: hypothetical protein JXB62_09355 [Pirellulales bacterium]|nr:hypothetical protein [Pirellulales bacterium]